MFDPQMLGFRQPQAGPVGVMRQVQGGPVQAFPQAPPQQPRPAVMPMLGATQWMRPAAPRPQQPRGQGFFPPAGGLPPLWQGGGFGQLPPNVQAMLRQLFQQRGFPNMFGGV